MRARTPSRCLAVVLVLCAAAAARAQQWTVHDPGQGPVMVSSGDSGARQLSGITWAGGNRYYAVSDKVARLFSLSIDLDPHTGAVRHTAIAAGVPLAGSRDLEGIAFDPEHDTVLVSDETGPGIREYRLADGGLVRAIELPPVFAHIRKNLSLESLSMAPDHRTLWTANEETLATDGPISTTTTGSVVRLQRFDHAFRPAGQWAYVTEPLFGDLQLRGRDKESSGVSDLVALPDGGLIVLERAYGMGGLRIGLYEVDFAGATDVSELPSLAGAHYTPVHKTRLWQRLFPTINYEGATLGPELSAGGRSLLLISDDGHLQPQALYALRIERGSGD
jgi:hypothetical protein